MPLPVIEKHPYGAVMSVDGHRLLFVVPAPNERTLLRRTRVTPGDPKEAVAMARNHALTHHPVGIRGLTRADLLTGLVPLGVLVSTCLLGWPDVLRMVIPGLMLAAVTLAVCLRSFGVRERESADEALPLDGDTVLTRLTSIDDSHPLAEQTGVLLRSLIDEPLADPAAIEPLWHQLASLTGGPQALQARELADQLAQSPPVDDESLSAYAAAVQRIAS